MLQNPPLIVAGISFVAGVLFLLAAVRNLKKFRLIRVFKNSLLMFFCILITAISGLILIANNIYSSFSKETLAAVITVKPQGEQQFIARVSLPDSSSTEYNISGDMLYIDAHILKWNPILNRIGIHTSYKLDRIGGRYNSISDEQEKPRSVYPLGKRKIIDMYSLRKRFLALKPLLDAQYGSATFISAQKAAVFHVMVSTSGLLVREGTESLK
jgi:hypothetical protein